MRADVAALWAAYRAIDAEAPSQPPSTYHFCDNQHDADACADLVLEGRKRATASSLAELELAGEPIPQVGDLAVVTRWNGEPVAVIRTVKVEIRKFCEVDERFAQIEGEGDLTLTWWRDAHKAYYERVLSGSKYSFSDDLDIACEEFEIVLRA